jgi:hypothetical protein
LPYEVEKWRRMPELRAMAEAAREMLKETGRV